MRLIDADSVLKGIEELKQSPWFNRGKEIVKSDPGFQHIGYLERKEAVETVRDLCIRQEPTVGGWISVKDRLPEATEPDANGKIAFSKMVLVFLVYDDGFTYQTVDTCCGDKWLHEVPGEGCRVTHWMPLPEPPKERDENDATDRR